MVDREKLVIATKITGGRNVTPRNIQADCELVGFPLKSVLVLRSIELTTPFFH
jgi:hypothetical protein